MNCCLSSNSIFESRKVLPDKTKINQKDCIRGVVTGWAKGTMGSYFIFRTKQGPTVLVSQFHKNFMAFTFYAIIFGQFVAAIYFL